MSFFKLQVILVPTVMSSSTADVQWDSVASSFTLNKDNSNCKTAFFSPQVFSQIRLH